MSDRLQRDKARLSQPIWVGEMVRVLPPYSIKDTRYGSYSYCTRIAEVRRIGKPTNPGRMQEVDVLFRDVDGIAEGTLSFLRADLQPLDCPACRGHGRLRSGLCRHCERRMEKVDRIPLGGGFEIRRIEDDEPDPVETQARIEYHADPDPMRVQ